jgi:hypothetical protein
MAPTAREETLCITATMESVIRAALMIAQRQSKSQWVETVRLVI